jgi:hypothetical protein
VLIDVNAAGPLANRHVVTSVSPKLAVFGVEEFSGVFGVPTFYVIPGLIMLVTLTLLSSWFGKEWPTELAADSKQFWVIAIGLSLAMAYVIYPFLTGLTGDQRTYLSGLGTEDVATIWFLSILIPIVSYGPVRLWLGWHRRNVPNADDSPRDLLAKLASTSLKVGRPVATIGDGGNKGLLVQDKRRGADRYWLSPQIVLDFDQTHVSPDVETAAERELTNSGSIAALWAAIKDAADRELVTMDWKAADQFIRGVQDAPAADVNLGGTSLLAVKKETS